MRSLCAATLAQPQHEQSEDRRGRVDGPASPPGRGGTVLCHMGSLCLFPAGPHLSGGPATSSVCTVHSISVSHEPGRAAPSGICWPVAGPKTRRRRWDWAGITRAISHPNVGQAAPFPAPTAGLQADRAAVASAWGHAPCTQACSCPPNRGNSSPCLATATDTQGRVWLGGTGGAGWYQDGEFQFAHHCPKGLVTCPPRGTRSRARRRSPRCSRGATWAGWRARSGR